MTTALDQGPTKQPATDKAWRDEMAGRFAVAVLSNRNYDYVAFPDNLAERAFDLADAMVAERMKRV
jgi:hypothetical protein